MSYRLVSAAWELPLDPKTKLVLVRLADFAGDDGVCWPAIERIVRDTGLSKRSVQTAIRLLVEQDGVLVREEWHGRKGTRYRLTLDGGRTDPLNGAGGAPFNENANGAKSALNGAKSALNGAKSALNGAGGAPESSRTIKEPPKESSGGPARAPARNTPDLFRPPPLPVTALPAAEVLAAWNRMAETAGIPAVVKLTDDRRRSLTARLREHGLAAALAVVERIGASAFCRGENDRGWRADFDFMLQPRSFVRALEGKYDNVRQRSRGEQALGAVFAKWDREEQEAFTIDHDAIAESGP